MNERGGRYRGRGRPATGVRVGIPANINLIEVIANLQRQLQNQQREVNEFRANGNGGEVHNERASIPHQQQERVATSLQFQR